VCSSDLGGVTGGAFAAAIAQAASASPQVGTRTAMVPGRTLLADGDGLAYYCAGNDDTDPGQARVNLLNKLAEAKAAAGCEFVRVLTTASGSTKGHRYAVARVKAYQGQRSNSRRPKNWGVLRQLLEGGFDARYPVELTARAEADDLFGKYATQLGCANVVHFTQDKDMRMLPGWHMEWRELRLTFVPDGCFDHTFNDKQYGIKWFWLQMLHGDAADYVPGLPKYAKPDGKLALCGEATAAKLLADCTTSDEARATVFGLYRGFWGDEWEVNVLEQGVLLWMRTDDKSSALDVCAPGNPLFGISDKAVQVILTRIAEGQV
jgi:DNA polymerase-1